MNDYNRIATELGKMASELLGSGPANPDQQRYKLAARRALEEISERPLKRRVLLWGVPSVAAAAAIVVTLSMTIGFGAPKERRFHIGDTDEYAAVGSYVRNNKGEEISLTFDGGSRLELRGEALARVVESNHQRVRLDMNYGVLKAWINKDSLTEWIVNVSGFEVIVHGTVFTVRRDPTESAIIVEVEEGRVEVKPIISEHSGVFLNAGHWLTADAERGEMKIIDTEKRGAIPRETVEDSTLQEEPIADPVKSPIGLEDQTESSLREAERDCASKDGSGKKAVDAPQPISNWQRKVRNGEAASVIKSADKGDIQRYCNEADLSELR